MAQLGAHNAVSAPGGAFLATVGGPMGWPKEFRSRKIITAVLVLQPSLRLDAGVIS